MAKRDFVPRNDAQFIHWLTNFCDRLPALAAGLGLTPADATAMADDQAAFTEAVDRLVTAKATAQSLTATKNAARAVAEERARSLAARIKTHPAYTPATGEDLGIVGPEVTPAPGDAQPDLKAVRVVAGQVEIAFVKGASDGVEIRSRRGAEKDFVFLARDTQSPYIDTRANLSPAPEKREYIAYYLNGDEVAGAPSDVLVVTAPGV